MAVSTMETKEKRSKRHVWKEKSRGVVVVFAVLVVALLAVFPSLRPVIIDFLLYEDEPVEADVIILLSGDTWRMKKAAQLYHEGYANKVLLTTARAYGASVDYALSFGIRQEDLLTEWEATSTYENAAFSKEIVLENEFQSALVVTSNYHMRRTKLAYDRVFRDTDVELTYVPYQHDSVHRDSWNENKSMFTRELIKLLGGYVVYYEGMPFNVIREWLEDDVV